MDMPTIRKPRSSNKSSLVGDERLAELERYRQASLARLAEHLAPLTARLIEYSALPAVQWRSRTAAIVAWAYDPVDRDTLLSPDP